MVGADQPAVSGAQSDISPASSRHYVVGQVVEVSRVIGL